MSETIFIVLFILFVTILILGYGNIRIVNAGLNDLKESRNKIKELEEELKKYKESDKKH